MAKLEDYCHISSGGTPSRSKKSFYGGDILWATISDIEKSNGRITDTKEKITEEGLSSIGNRLFPKNTLLLSMYGSIGKTAIAGIELATNQAILGIRPKKEDEIYLPFLSYWLQLNTKMLKHQARGGILKNLSAKIVRNLKIDFPDYDTQINISQLLFKIESLIQKREDSIKLLDKLIQSKFWDLFKNTLTDDKPKKLMLFKDFVFIDTNMVNNFNNYKELPHIGIGNIEKETGKILDYNLVKDENLISGKYLFDERHILYSKIRPNLNKVAIPNFKGLLSADGYPLLANEEYINKYFLAYLLKSKLFLTYILSHCARANIPKVNMQQLSSFKCNIPDKDLQNKFADIVKKIEKIKQIYIFSLNELNELFGSVSQKAFKGELDLSTLAFPEIKINEEIKNLEKTKEEEKSLEFSFDKEDLLRIPLRNEQTQKHLEEIYTKYAEPITLKVEEDEVSGYQMDIDTFKLYIKEVLIYDLNFNEIYTFIHSKGWTIPYDKKFNKNNTPFTYKETIFELLKNGEIVQGFDKTKQKIVLKSAQ